MNRCQLCRGRIWPWQHYGFIVGVATWHVHCLPARLRGARVEEIVLWLS